MDLKDIVENIHHMLERRKNEKCIINLLEWLFLNLSSCKLAKIVCGKNTEEEPVEEDEEEGIVVEDDEEE